MIKKQTNPEPCQLFTSPRINIETLKRGAFPWDTCSSLPLIYYQGPTVLWQCHASVLFSLAVIWGWLTVGYREVLGVMTDLPPSLSFCLFFPPLEILIGVVLQLGEQGFPHLSFMTSPQRERGFIFLSPPLHLERSPSIVLLTMTDTKVVC